MPAPCETLTCDAYTPHKRSATRSPRAAALGPGNPMAEEPESARERGATREATYGDAADGMGLFVMRNEATTPLICGAAWLHSRATPSAAQSTISLLLAASLPHASPITLRTISAAAGPISLAAGPRSFAMGLTRDSRGSWRPRSDIRTCLSRSTRAVARSHAMAALGVLSRSAGLCAGAAVRRSCILCLGAHHSVLSQCIIVISHPFTSSPALADCAPRTDDIL